jgi:hypothetical protein
LQYDLLQDYLTRLPTGKSEVTLSFSEIESILRGGLPASAYRYPAWWANQSDLSNRPQARAWVHAGFRVDGIGQERDAGWVRFVRTGVAVAVRSKVQTTPASNNKGKQNKLRVRSAMADDARFQPSENALYLVSCVSKKADRPSMAMDLYVSPWFSKARDYVERRNSLWYVLSAEYGLVHPEQVIAPYEQTLNRMSVAERRKWAEKVIEQMRSELPDAPQIVLFAGQRYREFLLDYFVQRYPEVVAPLSRLGIGEQLGWFDRDSRDGPA